MKEHAFSRKSNIVPLRKEDSPRSKLNRATRVTAIRSSRLKKNPLALRVLLVVLCACMLHMGWSYYKLMGDVKQQETELDVIQQRVAESKLENERLQHQKQILNSDAFIEKTAREELGMIKDGEILMKVAPEGNK